ncbi:serine/threonine-protein kinase Nek1-like [Oscarella lobularis]|uniref:serine/threonine-protein kinase Nek1-like n=1 Tax=Oscarella lobularis TaxID=121494 RepID=UPI00331321EF
MENYVTEKQIGRGGGGLVFLVRDKRDSKSFALKQIYLDPAKKSRNRETVMKEVNILSKLRHPNVVCYKESFFDDREEHLCIVQDYCDGGTLHQKIEDAKEMKERISEDKILQWFVQVTLALQHIHSQKVLHRDLKSQNVFLTKNDIVKVGDFGISKMLDSTLDMAQTCVGTPYYLSPELCQDLPYNSKSDMWALGCLLYELCELQPAFNASSLVGLIHKIVKGTYMPVSSQYSRLIHSLVSSLLSKSPDDRPSAAAILNMPEIKRQLNSFIQHTEAARTSEAKRPSSAQASGSQRTSVADTRNREHDHSPSEELGSGSDCYSDDFDDVSSSDASSVDAGASRRVRSRKSSRRSRKSSLAYVSAVGGKRSGESLSPPLEIEDDYAEDFESDDSDDDVYDKVLTQARNVLDTEVCEHFVAGEPGDVLYGQGFKSYCADVLDERQFKDILDCFGHATDLKAESLK